MKPLVIPDSSFSDSTDLSILYLYHQKLSHLELWGDDGDAAGGWLERDYHLSAVGDAGRSVDFHLRNDVYLSGSFLLICFFGVWLLVNSWRFLLATAKDFFYVRQRENLFAERSNAEMQGRWLLVLLTCVLLAFLFFSYVQHASPALLREVSSYHLLLLEIGCVTLGYFLKLFVTRFVNSIFFDDEKCRQWSDSYLLLTYLAGLLFLPMGLLSVYAGWDFEMQQLYVSLVLIIVFILLVFKSFRIFFRGGTGFVHLFLYLCALEILPTFLIWRGMVWASTQLSMI